MLVADEKSRVYTFSALEIIPTVTILFCQLSPIGLRVSKSLTFDTAITNLF